MLVEYIQYSYNCSFEFPRFSIYLMKRKLVSLNLMGLSMHSASSIRMRPRKTK